MKLSDQVCSLEHAKKLKELGVKQNSYFYWDMYNNEPELFNVGQIKPSWFLESQTYSAFTVAELGEILRGSEARSDIDLEWGYVGYDVIYKNDVAFAGSEVTTRAKMLIYLLENKLI